MGPLASGLLHNRGKPAETAGEKVSTNPQTKAAGKPQVKNPLANHR